ncbi:MAG: hypothetical protein ABSA91_18740, partial [Acidimicrobiales bacterium]
RGLERLSATTAVLHRARLARPLGDMWEAADVQWWSPLAWSKGLTAGPVKCGEKRSNRARFNPSGYWRSLGYNSVACRSARTASRSSGPGDNSGRPLVLG